VAREVAPKHRGPSRPTLEEIRWPTCELVMVAVEGKTGEGAARCTDGGKRSGRGQTDNRSQPYIGAALRVVGAWLVRWNAH
jgi:hypothetical protein